MPIIKNMMNCPDVKIINLDSLHHGIPALSPGKANMLKEACIWCLNKCHHLNGVAIAIQYDEKNESLPICWNSEKINEENIKRAYNQDDAIEYGAEAVSFLLIRECTQYTAIRRAATGTGIDYWLGNKKTVDNNILSNSARLEVSGILNENKDNTVKKRIKGKLRQTTPTEKTFPVFISVIEFSQPKAEMVLKNVKN